MGVEEVMGGGTHWGRRSKCSGTGLGFILTCGYLALWRSKWTLRLPLVEKRLPQMLHLKGRSPVNTQKQTMIKIIIIIIINNNYNKK